MKVRLSNNFGGSVFRKKFTLNHVDDEEVPYLLALQKESYQQFLRGGLEFGSNRSIGIDSVFKTFFPLSDLSNKVTLEFVEYSLFNPRFSAGDCLSAGRTYSAPLKVKLRLIFWDNELDGDVKEIKSVKEQEVYLADIPLMTDSGSFVINGAERVVVSQMRRSPGVFFDSEYGKSLESTVYTAKIMPYIGSWLDFEFDVKDILYFRIDKKKKIPVSTLLYAMGMDTEKIISLFYKKITICSTKYGWSADFDLESIEGKRISYDIIDSETNELKVAKGTKISRKIAKKLKEENLKKYILTEDILFDYVLAQNLVDSDTGEVLLELGSLLTAESLETLDKLGFTSIIVTNPSKSDIGPYIYNTILIDKNNNHTDASLYEIYKAVRLSEAPTSPEIAREFLILCFLRLEDTIFLM